MASHEASGSASLVPPSGSRGKKMSAPSNMQPNVQVRARSVVFNCLLHFFVFLFILSILLILYKHSLCPLGMFFRAFRFLKNSVFTVILLCAF